MMRQAVFLFLIFTTLDSGPLTAQDIQAPLIPVGADAYSRWDEWPLQRIGARTYMRSTYDRRGGSDDASHFLFMNKENDNVTLDLQGLGVLYFFRANHWHGSPWHFIADGRDVLVRETATRDPDHAKKISGSTEFIPKNIFPPPLNWTWGATKGADLIWTPIPFEKSLRISYSRTCYGTGYYIYQLFAGNQGLSRPVKTWNPAKPPPADVLALIRKSGSDIAPKDIRSVRGMVKLDKKRILLAEISSAPATVRAFKLRIPLDRAIALERVSLLVTWDGSAYPSIHAPLCLFFGAGTLFNRTKREYLVKGFPINIRYDYARNQVELSCYYPMPFFHSAKFELAGIDPADIKIDYEIRYEPFVGDARYSAYFHASYTDIPKPELGKDMVFLDTRGAEGEPAWSGSFVGTSFIFSHNANLFTLEGDPRFFFDDSQTPQGYGTGTEEWGGGGDYWGGENMTLPFAGHPCGAPSKKLAKDPRDLIESAYRFLLADLMPFGRRAVIRFEHSENVSLEHYEAVTYWYGLPSPSLIKTDSLDIGNPASERLHQYLSPDASPVETISSRYEWGIDRFPAQIYGIDPDSIPGYKEKIGTEVYPAHAEDGRFTRGVSEFSASVDPANAGVLIRRTLDYQYPNQTAELFVARADTSHGYNWESAGIWYLAGSNTCMFSRPDGETDKRQYEVQTSNRRFRDDEFLIPARLTRNRARIRIKIRFIPDNQLLYPGHAFPEKSAWSELRYAVYSYQVPSLPPGGPAPATARRKQ